MRVVLDANVLVSGVITIEGPCGRIMYMLFEESLQLCVDQRVLAEYERVRPRPEFRLNPGPVARALDVGRANGQSVAPTPLLVELPHPDELPFLEVAAEAGVILVTGNLRHFSRRSRAGVTVLSPREFLDLIHGTL